LDAGDIFQGTPYFNFFGGEVEMKVMSEMEYDAATIGNHDFDGGIDGLLESLAHASFPLINTNYDFSNTVMHNATQPYLIKHVGNIKIGITGVGIELNGLVPKRLYKETQYLDPIVEANKMAAILKFEHKCNYVICLSHLGYKYNSDMVSDVVLAKESKDIDLIIGGHTHTFMKTPDIVKNQLGKEVVVNQAGWAGIMLGRIDVFFEKSRPGKCVTCKNTYIG
jgi:5'-nucleotidase